MLRHALGECPLICGFTRALQPISHLLGGGGLKFVLRGVEAGVAFYHGGDPLYKLAGIPGLWHEQCLRLNWTPITPQRKYLR